MIDGSDKLFTLERIDHAVAMSRPYRRWWMLIVLTLLGVLFLSWLVLSKWTQYYSFETLAVEALSDETEIVVLGSSHVHIMTNPESFERPLMNLSADACNYKCMDAVLRGNIERVPNLRAVVVELDIVPLVYDTIHVYKGDNERLLDLQPSLADLDEDWSRKARLYWQRFFEYSPLSGPFISRNKVSPNVVRDRLRYGRHHGEEQIAPGHLILTTVMTEDRDGDDRLEVHEREGTLDQVDESIAALLRIIEYARVRDLQVVLLRYPHHRTYWEQRPASWDAEYDRALATVRQRFSGSEVEVWDLEKVEGFSDDDYFDGDHLNARGTEKLGEILNLKFNDLLARPNG